jgi:hypothetical protein
MSSNFRGLTDISRKIITIAGERAQKRSTGGSDAAIT